MHARLPALAALALLVAGCAAPAAVPVEPASAPAAVVDPARPDPTFADVATGPAAAADDQATLERPPVLQRGEWWRIRSQPFRGEPVEFVRVVAGAHDAGYVMGMPHEGWFKEAVAYHSPAFGDVALDLSYDTHNSRFAPVQFPLTEGATWRTEFATLPVTASVHVLDAFTAEITFTPDEAEPQPTDPLMALLLEFPDQSFTAIYDARQHEIVRFGNPVIGYDVVAHGYGFEGWVTVPRGEETPIDHGVGPPEVQRAATIPVAGGFNRLTMMHFLAGATPGAYRIRTLAPDGSEQVTASIPGQDMHVAFYEVADPDGDWGLEMLTAGVGFGYAMGIAYHQYDIHLPTGGIRADHSHEVIR